MSVQLRIQYKEVLQSSRAVFGPKRSALCCLRSSIRIAATVCSNHSSQKQSPVCPNRPPCDNAPLCLNALDRSSNAALHSAAEFRPTFPPEMASTLTRCPISASKRQSFDHPHRLLKLRIDDGNSLARIFWIRPHYGLFCLANRSGPNRRRLPRAMHCPSS